MIQRIGYCENFGECETASGKKPIEIREGANPICPECGRELEGDKSIPWKSIIFLALILLVLLSGALAAYIKWFSKIPENSPSTPSPSVSPTLSPNTSFLCQGEINQGVLNKIMTREYIIMGVQHYSPPMNSSSAYDDLSDADYAEGGKYRTYYVPKSDGNDPNEKKRREEELSWERSGFDYEIAKLIAESLDLKGKTAVKAREISEFADLFCLLNRKDPNGKFSVDMIMSGIAKDERYNDTIDWSLPYAEFSYCLITKKSSDIEDLEDCKNKKIGIVKGDNVVKKKVEENLPTAQIVELSDEENGWTNDALNKNKVVDAIIYDFPFAVEELKAINNAKEKTGIKGESLKIRRAVLPNFESKYCIGVAKGNDDLREEINEAIEKIKASPKYQQLIQEYMKPPPGAIEKVKATENDTKYIVKRGDTLSGIGAMYSVKWQDIQRYNNIGNEYLIFPGQVIYIQEKQN